VNRNDSEIGPYSALMAERYHAMTASALFVSIRKKWLGTLGRRTTYRSVDDWAESACALFDQPLYRESLENDLDQLSARFALPDWHIRWGLFIQGYSPLDNTGVLFPAELRYPRISLVVSGPDIEKFSGVGFELSRHDIQLVWEPVVEPFTPTIWPVSIAVELPLEIPSNQAINIVRRSRSLVRQCLLDKEVAHPGSCDTGVQITAICYGGATHQLNETSRVTRELGIPLLEQSGPIHDQGGPVRSNPLSYLRMQIRFAPGVTARDLIAMSRLCSQSGRQLARAMGVDLGKRIRTAPVTQLANRLKVNGRKLPPRGLGDLVMDDIEGFPRESSKPTDQARRLKATVKSRRNQILDRFRKKGLTP